MRRVLITGARAPIALDLARSFRAAGVEPHLADSVTSWCARLSTLSRAHLHHHAPPRFAFEVFRRDLERLVEELDPALIVPTCEEVFYVAEAAARGGFAERVFAPGPAVLRPLHSKVDFAHLALEAGLSAPLTARLSEWDDLEERLTQCRQLVFKPEFSRFGSHTLVGPEERALYPILPLPDAPWAAQALVKGEEFCLWSAARDGRIVAFCAYRPLWRLGRSASFAFERVDDPALLAVATAIAKATNATGHLSFDVIKSADGQVHPLECNPRGISGLHLFADDPRLARALMGEESDLVTPTAAIRHLGPAMWLIGLPQALASGRIGAFFADMKRGGDALTRPGDRLPALGALIDGARFAAVGLSRGRSAAGQSTDDIEWNGEPIR